MKDTFHMLAISSLGIALIFLIGFFLINYYSNRLLIKPLSILNQASAQIAEGHLEHEIPIESNDEIGRLADTFRKMGSSIKQGIDTLEQQVLKRTKELKKTNEELLIAEEEAAKANMAKTRFLANMSHEIRTPLNAIIGFTNILQKEGKTTQLPGKFYEYMEHINISGHNLAELINNILDLSKIESGKMNVVQETINLHLLIQGIFHVNKAHAMKNSVVLNYSISDELPTFVNTDRTKLNQILMNLTSNAIKFTPPGKRVTIIAKMEQTRILIQVMDEGIGIPRQKHQTIFEAFEQADDSTTRCYGGTGLGLPIVKQLTELLGGEILLNSKEGEGSCFSVHLPCDIAEDHTAPEVVNLDNVTFSSSLKLLLVEDNTNNQKFMTELLSLYGLNIILAENGKDGVEKCRYHKPDLILMDMHMPVMDGLEASKLILSAPESSDIPIIMLSADVFAEQKQAALDAGISDYLLKPVQTPELLRTLLKYLPAQETIPEENPLPVDSKICDSDFIEKMKIILAIPEYKTSLLLTSVNEILESYPQGCVEFSLMKQYKELIIFKKDSDAKELIKEFLNG
jgi:signal transduction histidine kinase/ActR/RegA family two-component response regulator